LALGAGGGRVLVHGCGRGDSSLEMQMQMATCRTAPARLHAPGLAERSVACLLRARREDHRMPTPRVVAVSRDETHRFSKVPAESITLVAGLGVLGDAHAGTLVQHRSRVRRDPNQLNLRQVHLIHAEVFGICQVK